jgi:hypothetical protein
MLSDHPRIAGSAEAAYALMSGSPQWPINLLQFPLPTLIGNVLGGVALVTLLNHGSIMPEMKRGTLNNERTSCFRLARPGVLKKRKVTGAGFSKPFSES